MRSGLLIVCCLFMPLSTAYAGGMDIPTPLTESLKKAMATEDTFVINATTQAAIEKYPHLKEHIHHFIAEEKMASLPEKSQPISTTEPVQKTPATAPSWHNVLLRNWENRAEIGFNIANGNTDRRSLNGALNFKRESEKWRHDLTLKARNVRENDVRENEDYRARIETDYKFRSRTYVFGSVEYVNDQFSGFDYRITEDIGLGHRVIDRQALHADLKGSVGGRHSQESGTNGRQISEAILKPAGTLKWIITDDLDFIQNISATLGADKTITEANSALVSKLVNNLYLKLALDIEHVSDVPDGTKKTDTTTTLNLVYDF